MIAQYKNELNDVISDDNLVKELISWCNKSESIEHAKVKERQLKKCEILIDQRELINSNVQASQKENKTSNKIKRSIVDLTRDCIDDDVKAYLSLGSDFAESPTRIPYENIICEIEAICSKIKRETGEDVTQIQEGEKEIILLKKKINRMLEKAQTKKFSSNLSQTEIKGKKKAYKDKEKVFLPADKGRIMVAMDKKESRGGKESYEAKMKTVLAK